MKTEELEAEGCDHGIAFDETEFRARHVKASEVRALWPRLHGKCPKGCGFEGIGYASYTHYLAGDW